MDKFRIRGGRPLEGAITIGGAKNAALPLMAAGLLTADRLVLTNVPLLDDIRTMGSLLAQHGVAVEKASNDGRSLSIALLALSLTHFWSRTRGLTAIRVIPTALLMMLYSRHFKCVLSVRVISSQSESVRVSPRHSESFRVIPSQSKSSARVSPSHSESF